MDFSDRIESIYMVTHQVVVMNIPVDFSLKQKIHSGVARTDVSPCSEPKQLHKIWVKAQCKLLFYGLN